MKRKILARATAAVVCGCLIGTSILPGMGKVKVQAQETTDSEWELVSSILDSYLGVYTKQTKLGNSWNTEYNPDGPFMGNGTLFAFMDPASREKQNIYISRSDMWTQYFEEGSCEYGYTNFGGISIGVKEDEVDLARGTEVTASGRINDQSGCEKLVDGVAGINNKWCVNPDNNDYSPNTSYWAVVDLGEKKNISRWVVKHAQAGGESSEYNTRDFQLQYTTEENPDGGNDTHWIDADIVTGNTEAVTDRNLDHPINTRYVRLLVTKAEQIKDTVRINDLMLFENPRPESYEFRQEQDMRNAEVRAQSESGFMLRNYVAAKENVLVTEIKNVIDSPLDLQVTSWADNGTVTSEIDEENQVMSSVKSTGYKGQEEYDVEITMSSYFVGGEITAMNNVGQGKNQAELVLNPGETIMMVTAVEGGRVIEHDESSGKMAVNTLNKISTDLENLSKEHKEWWKEYWLKSYVDFHNDSINRFYYGMLYQLGCAASTASNNNAGVAPGLFPWTTRIPAWQGAYFCNTDATRQVHPLVQANRTEGIENFINVIGDFWEEGRTRASDPNELNLVNLGNSRPEFTEGIRGVLFPTAICPWGMWVVNPVRKYVYQNQPSNASSMLMPLVRMWQFTQEDEFLKDWLYPKMKDLTEFWMDYLVVEDGKYVIYGGTHEGQAGRNSIFDLMAIRYIITNTIDASITLEVDEEEREEWQYVLDNLSDYPTVTVNGKERFAACEGNGYLDGNPVTVQGAYYFDAIDMTMDLSEREKVINYLDAVGASAWASSRGMNAAIRAGYQITNPDEFAAKYININPGEWSGIRGNNTSGDLGRAAWTSVLQESLLQSQAGFLHFFPNWRSEGEFTRMRARGAFLVDAYQNEFDQVEYVNVNSEKGKDCSVLNPWQDEGCAMKVLKDGEEVETTVEQNSLGDVYTFQTEAGADYELRPAAELPAIVDIVESEEELFLEDTLQLNVRTNAEAEIVWSSSDQSIATVENGIVAPKKIGDVTITAVQNGNEAVSDSCMIHVVADKKIDSSLLSAVADSEENKGGDGPAGNAVDGDESTIWHSGYSSGKVKPDIPNNINNSFTIDLGDTYTVGRFDYVPRPSTTNGDILGYELWYSTEAEGENFVKLTEGTWESTKDTKTAVFDPVECRRIRLRAMSTVGRDQWISAAEFYVYKTIVPEQVSKTTLEYFLNKAKGYVEDGSVDSCVESVQKLFAEAITEGDAVMADTYATRKEVTNAAVKLMLAIQALDLKAGDKTDLEMAVELAGMIDLTKYVEEGQAEFTEALENAKEVLSDGDAFQEDIDSAWNALVDAISNLRLKADKSVLEDLINEAEGIDTSLYTEESVAVFTAAFQKANTVLADETLSEDDQAKVDETVNELSAAIDGLEAKAGSGDGDNAGDGNAGNDSNAGGSGNNNGTGQSDDTDSQNGTTGNQNRAAKTGDTGLMVFPIIGIGVSALLALSAGAALVRRKRR